MQHAQYNAAYMSSAAQAATAYNTLINDACEALLNEIGYAVAYYTGDCCYLDVLDFVSPSFIGRGVSTNEEVTEEVMDLISTATEARMHSITGLHSSNELSEDAVEEVLAQYIGWTA